MTPRQWDIVTRQLKRAIERGDRVAVMLLRQRIAAAA